MIKNKNTLALFLFIPAGLLIISNLITVTAGFDAFVKMIICFSSGTIIFYGFKSAKGSPNLLACQLYVIVLAPEAETTLVNGGGVSFSQTVAET